MLQQSGSSLTGSISIKGSPGAAVTGTVAGSSIRFGTVGQGAVTYTGTISGNTMSGNYQAQTSGSGTWMATKSS
jgi:hypothetical protein